MDSNFLLSKTKTKRNKKLPGWIDIPSNLLITAKECILAKLCLYGEITPKMFQAGFYYGVLSYNYHYLIGSPQPVSSKSFDLGNVSLSKRSKYALKGVSALQAEQEWVKDIEHYWTLSHRCLTQFEKRPYHVLLTVNKVILENKVPSVFLTQWTPFLRKGLNSLVDCYGSRMPDL